MNSRKSPQTRGHRRLNAMTTEWLPAKSLQIAPKPSTSLREARPQVEVEANSAVGLPAGTWLCRLAAHAAGHGDPRQAPRRPPSAPSPSGWTRSSAPTRSAPGAPSSSAISRAAGPRSSAAARPARVPRDGQGLRHAAGRAEVRAREGQQDPRSSAGSRRARPSAASPSASAPSSCRCSGASRGDAQRVSRVFVITGPSGVGKGTLIRRLRSASRARAIASRRRRARRARARSDGVDYRFLSDEEFDARVAAGEFVEHADVLGAALRDAALRARAPHRRRAPGGAGDRGPGRAPGPRGDARGGADLHRAAVARRAARRAWSGAAPTTPSRSSARLRVAERGARRPGRVRPRRGQRPPRGRRRRARGDRPTARDR